jgi:nuclease S1
LVCGIEGIVGMVRWPGILATVLLTCVAFLPPNANAWGSEGHHVIAEVAETQLTAAARAEVSRLLALDPGSTLASISTWADETRSPSTAAWHYVNLPRDGGCKYEAERSCVAGACVVGAIERQAAVLASNAPDEARLKALKYVVHFVADVHQPLHAGFADDRGGNTFQLQAFGRGTNLHALWDSGLIAQWPGGESALRAAVGGEKSAVDTGFVPGRWAEESCRVVSTDGFYPSRHKLDDAYAQRWDATLVERMASAARRLAAVLNQSLANR